MRFYGESYDNIMNLPIKAFWLLSAQIDRIRSEETLWEMRTPNSYCAVEEYTKRVEELTKILDNPIKYDIMIKNDFNVDDYNDLKRMSKQRIGK